MNAREAPRPVPSLRRLKPGDHACLIYRTRAEQMAAMAPFLLQGLENGERCMVSASPADGPVLLRALSRHGLDVDAHCRSRQIVVVSGPDIYAPAGVFEPAAMTRRVESAVDSALDAGWKGLRVASDAAWLRGSAVSWSRLYEYEALVENVFRSRPLVALCMYRERDHSARHLLQFLGMHPLVSAGGATCRNFFRHAAVRKGDRAQYRRYLDTLREWEDAERERESQLALFRSLVENMQAGVLIETCDRRVMAANQSLCTLLAIPAAAASLAGQDAARLMERVSRLVLEPDAFLARQTVAVAERRPLTGEIIRFVDGQVCERDYVPIAAADGSVLGHMWQYRDVTERVDLEEQLRQSQKMEAVGRLAGGIAHDFNNLMTAVIGYSETILLDLPGDDPLGAEIGQIKSAAERAVSLTAQLLAFSRKALVAPQVMDLNAAVANVDRLLRRLIGEDVELVTLFSSAPALVRADPGHVHQVLMNLAINARDAMPAGGKLSIHVAHADPATVTLTFADTGCGMEPDVMEHIFEPFFSTKEGRGTGLGLTLVYGIVQQHGGTIRVASEPGRGSTFTIALPACSLPDAAGPSEAGDRTRVRPAVVEPAALSSPETVLLVEDDPTMRGFARKILMGRGYHVLEAGYGIQALDVVERHDGPIHLLLTDVVMPHMSGPELARRLLELRPGVRVLFMSGYSEHHDLPPGLMDVDAAFLPKPFTLRTLLGKVREVLDA